MVERVVDFLDRAILGAEGVATDFYPTEFGPVIVSAIATVSLKETAESVRRMGAGLNHLAVSCEPDDPASWLALEISDSSASIEPWPLQLPAQLSTMIANQFGSPGSGQYADLGYVPISSIDVPIDRFDHLDSVRFMYYRRATLALPAPPGKTTIAWLAGSEQQLPPSSQARLEEAIKQSERLVCERLVHGLGGYRPVANVLAAIDDHFHEAMLTARSAAAISEILDHIGSDPLELSSAVNLPPIEAPVASDTIEIEKGALTQAVRRAAQELFGALPPHAILNVDGGGQLQTPCGRRHGWLEFGEGFAGWSNRQIAITVVDSRDDFEAALAQFVGDTTKTFKRVQLLILLRGGVAELLPRLKLIWSNLRGVHVASIMSDRD